MIRIKRDFATENLVKGQLVYGERIIKKKGKEFRIWDPKRSKVGAALQKGMKIPLTEDMIVLYLGVASGTTASHISDEVKNGMIYGVDPAPRVLRDFLLLSEVRKNLVPILKDANRPEIYKHLVPEVDLIIQDVAQPNQAQILIKNIKTYLKKGGLAFVAIKARSIDVTSNPRKIFKEFKHELKDYKIIDEKSLEPFEKDHLALLIRN
ncbi:MAG: fibrillarin-like rRNA/tRNA 2'-O-methyltransferase [Candidatus Altiarchaeota archaeon]|nr:fibrillarin-like rRNA/tRNA 2'-O-methyltransferase [Candidatus Altiarchaeota archaeon]